MKYVALHGFKSPEGKFDKGELLPDNLDAVRAKALTEGGYIKSVTEAEAKTLPPVAVANPAAISTPAKAKE